MPPLTIASPLKMAMRSNAKAKNRSHPWHIPKFVKRSYPVGNRTLSPKLFLKTLVSLVNSPMRVVILPLNSIDPEAPCLGLVQNTSGKREILEVVFRNGWDYMKPVLVAEKTDGDRPTPSPFSAHYM